MRQPIRLAARIALTALLGVMASAALTPASAQQQSVRKHDLSKEKVLYCVGYAHLDTQWRWDYTTTIDEYVRATLLDNFDRFEKYPGYSFNFTGSVRYGMMKEYYPAEYERLKKYIAQGRWFVSGSSVDEGDVNVPSAEAVLRQVLYGNQYFRREFGKESVDFMLPDCFGFPASMPSIWAHAGLRGFSTQKLTWGSAVGIPFKIGVWEGLDGKSIIAALDPGSYGGGLKNRVDLDPEWVERVERNGREYGVFADYHYYGTGDQGGAPREEDVANYVRSVGNPDGRMQVELGSSDQMYVDITDAQAARLPRYRGDMLLTEHSAGTLSSQAYMKRWNRQGEQLADAAERMAVGASWLAEHGYPLAKMGRTWERLLANQMHDILPGTSIPRAYTFSWNDEIIAQNGFAAVLTDSVESIASTMNTGVETGSGGMPLIVVNPLAIEREDPVEAEIHFNGATPAFVRIFDSRGVEVPSQVLSRSEHGVKMLFLARVPSVGLSVFEARAASSAWSAEDGPRITARSIENDAYRVTLDDAGDVVSIIDKHDDARELLRAPAQLVFTREKPRSWPAWNMDWADRQRPPIDVVGGPATIRIVESGPVRVALEVTRGARDSVITQRIRLCRGDAGRRVEFDSNIDWQSAEVALRASFPLTVSNPKATYNWGMGTIERGNNEPTKYEVPSHEWFDLTAMDGTHGVSILEDSKFGSDKPDDSTLRLTLLYSPGVHRQYQDQHSQDWGRHQLTYALFAHRGDWREGFSEWQGRRLNQPLRVFQTVSHAGTFGREVSLASTSTPQVDIRALKAAEDARGTVIRLQELWGRETGEVEVTLAHRIGTAWEVDGQERRIGDAVLRDGKLVVRMTPYSPRSFAVFLAPRIPPLPLRAPSTQSVITLPFNEDVMSSDGNRADGRMDGEGRTYPAEMLPARIDDDGIVFELGSTAEGAKNAVSCQRQRIALPQGAQRVHLLVAATEDVQASWNFGSSVVRVPVQSWTGFVGQWDDRIWDREFGKVDHETEGKVTGLRAGYIKRANIAWFATHRHHPTKGNEAYRFSYLYHVALDVPRLARTLTLPGDPRVRVFAVTTVTKDEYMARPAAALYDDFTGRVAPRLRHVYPPPPRAVFEGTTPVGTFTMDKAATFDALAMGAPSRTDFVDASQGRGIAFRIHDGGGDRQPHGASGAKNGALPRLNDGQVAQNDDDTAHCAWYDTEGRFSVDLGAARHIESVNTYSWHVNERAMQWFSLWGSAADVMPSADFEQGAAIGWTLLAVVDTRSQGQGGVQASSVTFDMPIRHLLWVAQDVGNGTFLTEIDVHAAP